MMTQLNPPIPLKTPKGRAWAVALLDYGPHWDLQWVTFLHDSGECWTFRNSQIRQEQNYTFGMPEPSPIHGTGNQPKEPRPPLQAPANSKPAMKEPEPKQPPSANLHLQAAPEQTRHNALLQAMLDMPARPFQKAIS